jgi:inositol transport system permease protein
MVGTAAIMLMSRAQGLDIHQTSAFELNSIAIAVMGGIAISGGRGNLTGTMLATVVVAVLLNILNLAGFGSFYQSAIAGLIVVILAVVYQRRESRRLRERLMVEV